MTGDLWTVAIAILSAFFSAGFTYAAMKMRTRQNETDIRGVADFARASRRLATYRWLLGIAAQIEELEPAARAARLARELREGAARE